jgi:V8-like Glu-specific endopeptidase
VNPWRQICALRIHAPTGTSYVGTAWFIGPGILATAGHCVFLRNEGGWATSIDVIPGRRRERGVDAHGVRYAPVVVGDTGGRTDYGGSPDDRTSFARQHRSRGRARRRLVGAAISGYPATSIERRSQCYHERRCGVF